MPEWPTCGRCPFDTWSAAQDNFLFCVKVTQKGTPLSSMPVDNDLKRAMRDLGHALVYAIAASPKVGEAVRRIRHQGYSLYLVLDQDEGEKSTQIQLADGNDSTPKPDFRLNKADVSFLKSVGIDATRRGKRRRTR